MATRSHTSILRGACSIRRPPACCNWGRYGCPLPHLLMIPFIFVECDVAERRGRFDSFDDRLRVRGRGNISPGARRARRRSPNETGGWLWRTGCGIRLWSQSEPDLHAGDGHDGVDLSGAVYLGRRVLLGIRPEPAKRRPAKKRGMQMHISGQRRRRAIRWPAAPSVWPVRNSRVTTDGFWRE